MNRFHTLYSLSVPVLLLSLCLFLSSCAGDDITSTSQNSGDTTMVKLSFCISDGNQTRAITSANENIVSDITVLIFDASGSLIGSQYLSSISAGTVSVPVTARSATGCTIYAIANTGSSSYFAGVNTISKLNTLYTTIASADALESSGSTAGSTGALMIGKASADITTGGANQFSISLYHQCGKFSFTIKPNSGVTITGYQLCNVPLSSYITDSHVPVSASTVVGPPAGASSYGNFTAVSGLSQTTDLSKTYYVYENLCGSNSNATSEALRNSSNVPVSASASASYLLINAKSSIWASTYRVYLGGMTNAATPATDLTNFNVYRNLNYNCTITLGANGGNGDARVTYQATGQGTRSGSVTGTATIGNYLYSNGTTGTSGTPPAGTTVVGIVFSNQLSSAEYSAGYTHGYALALTDASTGTTWGPYGLDAGLTKVQTFSAYYNDINAGYYGTVTKGYNKSNGSYSAWQVANNYNVNVSGFTNSGWYLPSIGQWWDVAANLGKVNLTGMQAGTSGNGALYNGSTATTNVNAAINAAVGGQALTSSTYYWSASEYSPNNAAIVFFGPSYVGLSYNGKYTYYYVRAVLAF
nr:fimbrial protein [Segatella paludivivens]